LRPKSDDPDTPYNEKEPCEIKHIFLTLKVIIDFVTFKLAFLLLPIMALVTGACFIWRRTKQIWPRAPKIFGKKSALVTRPVFSWIIVSIIMTLVGYEALWNQIL